MADVGEAPDVCREAGARRRAQRVGDLVVCLAERRVALRIEAAVDVLNDADVVERRGGGLVQAVVVKELVEEVKTADEIQAIEVSVDAELLGLVALVEAGVAVALDVRRAIVVVVRSVRASRVAR